MIRSSFRQIIQYDENLGHKYVPNLRTRLRHGNDGYYIVTDDQGFRNVKGKKTGKLKIVAIGDSFTAGDGVSNWDRFTDMLERTYDCEITNLAVSGYGVDQQVLAYEKYGNNIDHDLVLFVPHLDDMLRNMLPAREGIDKNTSNHILIPKPYYTIQNGDLELQNVPVPRERSVVDEEPGQETSGNRFVEFYKFKKRKREYFKRFTDESGEEWKLMDLLLQRLKQQVNGKPIVTVPLPFHAGMVPKTEDGEAPQYLKAFKDFMEVYGKYASEQFSILDISESLIENHLTGTEPNYLPMCKHFTPFGHGLIADLVAGKLRESFDLDTREEVALETVKGDEAVYVLGISCFYHDSAATLIKDGVVVSAAQEERFTRVKHDKAFPDNAINYCLEAAGLGINDLKAFVYYDYESWTIERVLHNAKLIGDKGPGYWDIAKKSLYQKLKLPYLIRSRTNYKGEIFKTQHHVSHAASAFYPSSFDNAAILIVDGVGEWACSTIAHGKGSTIDVVKQQYYPHSVGLLYSAFTYFCGFKVNSGEYKLMGLAPYGKPVYADLIKEKLIDLKDDGSIMLHLEYFSFMEGEKMTNDKFAGLFGGAAREGESQITRREMDLAASIQNVTEEIIVRMAIHAHELTGSKNLVMAGGVALNCVANGKLFDQTPFDEFYFQPASGDAGGALGCALDWYHQNYPEAKKQKVENAYLGPDFTNEEVRAFLHTRNLKSHLLEEEGRAKVIAEYLEGNKVVGHFDGAMEFGPRALGNRSILGNPLNTEMQSKLNLKIKYRESFRPFAPIYAVERTADYFDFDTPSPYMLIVRNVKESLLVHSDNTADQDDMIKIVNQKRSEIPAITHVDNSARLQSVSKGDNPKLHAVIMEFEKLTGKAVLINTSFNVRGEPIVCTVIDAYRCFMRTDMDVLVLNDHVLLKDEQPEWEETDDWRDTFVLD